jgi:hypothetical protein
VCQGFSLPVDDDWVQSTCDEMAMDQPIWPLLGIIVIKVKNGCLIIRELRNTTNYQPGPTSIIANNYKAVVGPFGDWNPYMFWDWDPQLRDFKRGKLFNYRKFFLSTYSIMNNIAG